MSDRFEYDEVLHELPDTVIPVKLYVQIKGIGVAVHLKIHPDKNPEGEHNNDQSDRRPLPETDSDCQTLAGAHPQPCRRGQPPDMVAPCHNDGANAQKSHSADHLGTQPCHIALIAKRHVHVLADQHHERRSHTHKRVSLHPGSPSSAAALDSHQHSRQHGK